MKATLEQRFERYRRHGDVAALAEVFDRTAPEILRVAMHLARDAADAEELLQETFVAAIRRAQAFDPGRPLVPWLLGILGNLARNLARRAARRKGRGTDAARLPARRSGAEAATDGGEVEDAVAAAIDRIPEPYRAVLVLHLQHGLSAVQIAHALNVPAATVRSQLHRGLRHLRKRLPRSVAPRALAALPLTGGLAGVRETVLAEGAALSVAVPATAALVLGGLIVTKKILVAGAALLALVLLAGGTYLVLDADSGASGAGPEADAPTSAPARAATTEPGPSLTATGSAPPPAGSEPEPAAAAAPGAARRVPLDTPIPPGKGSVAGTLHFEDGTPVKGMKVALWGESPIEDVTDEEGAFHLHGDWVAGRQLYIKGEQRYDAVILKHVAMKADQLVEVAFTIERGHELNGVVLSDEDDEPVSDTLVVLRRPGSDSSDDIQAGYASHRTDEAGRFHFRFLPAASYTVELNEPGYEAYFGRVQVEEETADVTYRMKKSRPFLVTFEGLPDEAEGTRVGGMFSPPDVHAAHFRSSGDGLLDGTGTVRLDAPPPGRYRLTLFRGKFTDRTERQVEVGEEQGEPLVIPRVPAARIEGVLRDSRRKPLANTQLQIGKSVGLRTNEEGRFVIARSPLGKLSVWAHFATGWVTLPAVDVASATTHEIELTMPGASTLKGRVLKDRTQYGTASLRTLGGDQRQVAMITPDADGCFEVPHLAAGRYEFLWQQAGAEPVRREIELLPGGSLDLGELAGAPLPRVPVLVSVPRGTTRPIVLHMALAMPAGGANRRLVQAGRVRIDKEGRGAITTLNPGTYRLVFSAAPFAEVELDVTVVKGENETLSVSLEHP